MLHSEKNCYNQKAKGCANGCNKISTTYKEQQWSDTIERILGKPSKSDLVKKEREAIELQKISNMRHETKSAPPPVLDNENTKNITKYNVPNINDLKKLENLTEGQRQVRAAMKPQGWDEHLDVDEPAIAD